MEVAVEAVAGDLVIEAQGVVAGAAGARQRQFAVYPVHELGFTQALLRQGAGQYSGDQTGGRVRQDIVAGLAVEVDRLVDLVERFVGADARHLQRSVATRVDSGGFVVVPEDAGCHGGPLVREAGSLTPGKHHQTWEAAPYGQGIFAFCRLAAPFAASLESPPMDDRPDKDSLNARARRASRTHLLNACPAEASMPVTACGLTAPRPVAWIPAAR
ncbi:hypothetical protein D3C84_823870 [compost metagenome]